MPKQRKVNGQSVSRQLATSSENLVASTQFLVALATSWVAISSPGCKKQQSSLEIMNKCMVITCLPLTYLFSLQMIDLAKQGDEETINSWITVSWHGLDDTCSFFLIKGKLQLQGRGKRDTGDSWTVGYRVPHFPYLWTPNPAPVLLSSASLQNLNCKILCCVILSHSPALSHLGNLSTCPLFSYALPKTFSPGFPALVSSPNGGIHPHTSQQT